MNVIVLDDIALGLARPEVLDRAHGDAGVEQVVNVVVNDLVVGIVAHEHAHRFRGEPPAVGDLVVGHGDPPAVRALGHGGLALESPLGQLARPVRLPREEVTDPDSPRADVRDPVVRDLDVRAAHVHLDAVVADVFDAAAGDGASFGVIEEERAGHFDSGLERRGIVGRRLPLGMGKREAFEAEVVRRRARAPNDPHHLRQPRRNDLGRCHVLSRPRQIVEPSSRPIEIPLAGRVQGLEHVLHPVDRGLSVLSPQGADETRANRLGRSKVTVRVSPSTLSIGSRLSSHRVIPTTSTSRRLRQVGTMWPGA